MNRSETGKLTKCAMCLALATALSYVKLFKAPMGGSVTLCSMLFIVLTGYFYGAKTGLMVGTAYGILQFVLEPYFYTIPQVIIDYPLAFGALGISGFFYKKKNGLYIGYILSVFGRLVFATLSGFIFFSQYAPEGMHPFIYSLSYNGSYLGIEALITLAVISLPPVKNTIAKLKKEA